MPLTPISALTLISAAQLSADMTEIYKAKFCEKDPGSGRVVNYILRGNTGAYISGTRNLKGGFRGSRLRCSSLPK